MTVIALREYREDILAVADWFGDEAGSYDVEAVRFELLNLVNERLPEGWTLLPNGEVLVEEERQDADVDWDGLTTEDDLIAVAERHRR